MCDNVSTSKEHVPPVFVAFQGEHSKEPSYLVSLLINSGIKTIVNFDDKEQIIFNDDRK